MMTRHDGTTWEQPTERLSAGDIAGIAELYSGRYENLPGELRAVTRYNQRFEACPTTADGGVPGLNVDHNYTLSRNAAAAGGYVSEGAWFRSYQGGHCPPGTTPLFRHLVGAPWSGWGNRFYSTDPTPAPGYIRPDSPDLGCIAPPHAPLPGTVPLYQLYGRDRCVEQHRLLLDAARRDELTAARRFESYAVVGHVWPVVGGAPEPVDMPPGGGVCGAGCLGTVLGSCVAPDAAGLRWCDEAAATAQRCTCREGRFVECSPCAPFSG